MHISREQPGLLGRRIHIAGSARPQCDVPLLRYAHELVSRVTRSIMQAGGGLVVGAGKEPLVQDAQYSAPSIVFDWTVLEVAVQCLQEGSCAWPAESGTPLVIITSEKA